MYFCPNLFNMAQEQLTDPLSAYLFCVFSCLLCKMTVQWVTTMAGFHLGTGVVDGEVVVEGEVIEAALGVDGAAAEVLVMVKMILGVAEEVLIELAVAALGWQEVWMMIGLLVVHEQEEYHPETGMSSVSIIFLPYNVLSEFQTH